MAYITLSDVGDSSCACVKHLLGTNTQTLRGSWWCLTPTMCQSPAAPMFPAVVSLAGRGVGTLAQLQAGCSWWYAGTVTAGTTRWDVPPRGVWEVGFHLGLRHQPSTREICIHLLPALSLCAAPPAVKWGSSSLVLF